MARHVLILRALVREDQTRQTELEFRRLCAYMPQAVAAGKFDNLSKVIDQTLTAWRQLRSPWDDIQSESVDEIRALADLWAREFGDPDDPEVKARIDATAAALQQQTRGAT